MLPPGFSGTLLLYWGWQTRLLWAAAPLALAVEGARFFPGKWDFSAGDFNRFVDVSTIFLAAGFVIALTTDAPHALARVMQWLPMIFCPILLAQVFSHTGTIPVRSFFLAARRRARQTAFDSRRLDFSPVFAIACLCGAGSGHPGDPWFFPVCFVFSVWGLCPVRPKRFPAWVWLFWVLLAGILGYSSHKGFYEVRTRFHEMLVDYYVDLMGINPFKTTTAMGEIGELKLSGRIMFRVGFDPVPDSLPVYLHGATYDRFSYTTWFSSHGFEPVPMEKNGNGMILTPGPVPDRTMTFYLSPKKKNMLFLPAGACRMGNIKTGRVEHNRVSAVRISDGPSLLKGVVRFDPAMGGDAAPSKRDLLIPPQEMPHIKATAHSLGLEGLPPSRATARLTAFFRQNFSYSLALSGRGRSKTPLAHFLLVTRQGHCELFATATALLLRACGIPARYATGFVAWETEPLSHMMRVRQQDAHAWVKAWVDGRWIRVDTTPPGFAALDRDAAGNTLVRDLLSFLGFNLSRLRHETGPRLLDEYGLWLILPLVLILAYRLRFRKKVRRKTDGRKKGADKKGKQNKKGLENIQDRLAEFGYHRLAHETLEKWYRRIQNGIAPLGIDSPLIDLIRLENKRCFAQTGLTRKERAQYHDRLEILMTRLAAPPD